ncbi:hypothetical protein OHV05_07500 [Kitasatospora sp. NBC_00070]|uniref:hypothetical protein n=1 Tax=Kitasatospora sp. NBC_00070 TaxID=2975962 RepID=UPI00324875B4
MYRPRKKSLAAVSLLTAALAFAGTGLSVPAATAAASCQSYKISTSGGQVSYTECNHLESTPSYTTVQGSVKDVDADGQCAYAYTTLRDGGTVDEAKACPKGTTKTFSWTYRGYAPVEVQVYLREA